MELIVVSIAFPIGIFVYLVYSGLLANVEFSEGEFESFNFAYKKHRGDYAKVGGAMKELEKELKEKGIEYREGMGIYFDNPKVVKPEDLRSIAGAVLTPDMAKKAKEAGVQAALYPKGSGILSELPYKSAFSVMIGVFKVYPKYEEYSKENNLTTGATTEIYDKKRKKLLYFFPKENIEEINSLF